MASLRDIRTRIRSVKSTQQITKAMKLIAATRLRKAQENIISARPYADALDAVLGSLASGAGVEHPLLTQRPLKRVELVVMTSDRGLCGGFNSNLLRRAQRFLVENSDAHEIRISTVGRKGHDYFRKREVKLRHDYAGVMQKLSYGSARQIATEVSDAFLKGEVDAVYLLYNEFISAISQRPILATLLPVQPTAGAGKAAPSGPAAEYVYEPSRDAVLESLLPRYLSTKVYRALLESQAAFYGAQMSAMESATKNATDLIGQLTLLYNRTRQAVITKELMEIVSGAEALK
ncbi:MAG: ATP synthase F1 subunit gamma [Deltaproteobacteria bacterium]|nr:ATP synthase F1 subunit gamma [Deltaproteobacteria bacterium]